MSEVDLISLSPEHATPDEHCQRCDDIRRHRTEFSAVGKPCTLCAGRGLDFLGRPCPHADPLDHTDGTTGP